MPEFITNSQLAILSQRVSEGFPSRLTALATFSSDPWPTFGKSSKGKGKDGKDSKGPYGKDKDKGGPMCALASCNTHKTRYH